MLQTDRGLARVDKASGISIGVRGVTTNITVVTNAPQRWVEVVRYKSVKCCGWGPYKLHNTQARTTQVPLLMGGVTYSVESQPIVDHQWVVRCMDHMGMVHPATGLLLEVAMQRAVRQSIAAMARQW